MPFIATRNNERILPSEANKGDSLICPKCGDELSIVPSYLREGTFVSRHFRHQVNDDCGGESVPHLRMKSIAFSRLVKEYPTADITLEKSIGSRRADVLVEFSEPQHPLGQGIAVEVQHQNNSKDLFATDQDYYDLGYSVLWLSEQHYSGYDVEIDHVQPVWPNAIPQLKSYDGLRWPPIEPSSDIHIDVLLPQEYYDDHKQEIRVAYEEGLWNQSEDPWTTHEKVWLSRPNDTTKRSLQFVEKSRSQFFLKLSKGGTGKEPESVLIPISEEDRSRIERAPSLIDETLSTNPTQGNWEDIATHWVTGYNNPVTAWLAVESSSDNNYILVLGKKVNGSSEIVKTQFSPTQELYSEFQNFFGKVSQMVTTDG